MGYYTHFKMKWTATAARKALPQCGHKDASKPGNDYCPKCGNPTAPLDLAEEVGRFITSHNGFSYALERDGSTSDSTKWYEHEDDMKRISTEIPEVVFHLQGEGEEPGDVWDLYALNGKVEKVKARVERGPVPDWAKT